MHDGKAQCVVVVIAFGAFILSLVLSCLADPHGMFQLNDTVHLFFQYNPRAIAWGEPHQSA